jgi:hypothetical protein
MATVSPRRGPVHAVAGQATAAITGGRFVSITANNAGPALNTATDGSQNIQVTQSTAGAAVRGVAGHDAANDAIVTVYDSGTIPVEAGGTIAAGAKVMSGAAGVAVAWTTAASEANECVGTCEDGATSGGYALIKLNVA